MGVIQHQDENWYYYAAGVTRAGLKAGETIDLQRRTTHTHTRYDGELGDPALAQVDARIPEHQSLDTLNDKTSDIHVNNAPSEFGSLTNSAIGGIAAFLETTYNSK